MKTKKAFVALFAGVFAALALALGIGAYPAEAATRTIDGTGTYWGTGTDVSDDVIINGTLNMQGTNPQIHDGTLTVNSNQGFAIIVRNNQNTNFTLRNETVTFSTTAGLANVWNYATLTLDGVKMDGGGQNFGNKAIMQTTATSSRIVVKGETELSNFKNARLRAESSIVPLKLKAP